MSITRTLVVTVLIIAAAAIAGMAYTGALSTAFPFDTTGESVNTNDADGNTVVMTQAKNVQFGADFESFNYVRKTNWNPEYVTLWVGDWVATDQYGWDTVERFIRTTHAKGATPVIIWSYWGSDLTQDALASGANGKTVRGWNTMGQDLVDHIEQFAGDKPVVVVIEPEFNKNDVEKYKQFDTMLAEHIRIFEGSTTDITTVVGFGTWNYYNLLNFEESINAADMIGLNAVRMYPNHQKDYYDTVVPTLVESARFLAVNYEKPTMVYDFAISASDNELVEKQEEIVAEMCNSLGELEELGVKIVIYRYLVDPVKYVPEEERHWGLIEENGKSKPALDAWLNCVNSVKNADEASSDTTSEATVSANQE